jgi:hypothetical protein
MAILLILNALRGAQLFVCGETLFGQFLVLGTRTAVVGVRIDGDAATRGKEACDLDVFGIHQFDEVLHDDVYAVLVEVSVVSEAEKIELETLALDHLDVRDIADAKLCEVRLSCNRTERGELRAVETHPVVIALVLVFECLQYLRSVVHSVFGLAAKGLETFLFSFVIVHDIRYLQS